VGNRKSLKSIGWGIMKKELKTARGHMMPPPVPLFNIRCKCFRTDVDMASKKSAVNEQTNDSVYVGC